MKIVGVIPARFASGRFPGKMLADLLGKSLIQRTYENTCRSKHLQKIVVATDDERIAEHVRSFGGYAIMTSPSCPSGTDRVAEVIRHHLPDAEVVVNIQGDEPCLNPEVIDILVDDLLAQKDAVMTTPVVPLYLPEDISNPSIVKCVFTPAKKALYFSRSPIPFPQKDHSASYFRHLGVYCFRKDFLLEYATLGKTPLQQTEDLEQLKILEYGFPIYVSMVQDDGVGVDTKEDLKRVELLLCKENMFLSPEA